MQRMNNSILVGPPDRQKGPLCHCKSSHCTRRSQYVPASVTLRKPHLQAYLRPCLQHSCNTIYLSKVAFFPNSANSTLQNSDICCRSESNSPQCRCKVLTNMTRSANVVNVRCRTIHIGGGAMGAQGAQAPTSFILWGQCPHKL